MRRRLSGSPASPLPFRGSAPRTSQRRLPVPHPTRAGNAPVDWRASSTPHNSSFARPSLRPQPRAPVAPALQTLRRCCARVGTPAPSHSTRTVAAAPFHSAVPTHPLLLPAAPLSAPALVQNVEADELLRMNQGDESRR